MCLTTNIKTRGCSKSRLGTHKECDGEIIRKNKGRGGGGERDDENEVDGVTKGGEKHEKGAEERKQSKGGRNRKKRAKEATDENEVEEWNNHKRKEEADIGF